MRRAIYTGMSVMSVMLSVAASLAAPPLRWDTQQANPKAADWYIYRGEAVDLMPRLVDGTKPADITDTPATLRYREPALEPGTYRAIAATNTAPGTWLIPWRAEHDSGAPYYDYQLWIGDGPSASARITGKIIMRDSIGIPPSGSPPPPVAGWATPADLQVLSNALAQAMGEIAVAETDPIWMADKLAYLRRDAGNDVSSGFRLDYFTGSRQFILDYLELYYRMGGGGSSQDSARLNAGGLHTTHSQAGLTTTTSYGVQGISVNGDTLRVPLDTGGGTLALISDIAAIIASSNGWLTVSNGTLTVYAITNTATPATAIWSSAETSDEDIIPPAVTNQIWQAIGTLTTAVNAKADKAWGKYAPDGSANPDPSYMTFLNSPTTMFASGAQWATAGAYAVYATPGAAAFMAGDQGGELRIGPDVTTNYFGYKMGGSYMVGAHTDGIKVFNSGTEYGYVELTYDSYGDADPYTIWMTPDLRSVEWSIVEPVWVDDGETAVATVATSSGKGAFYRATTLAHFDSTFFSKMPASFEGGIFGDPNAPPVVANSTIIISHGGKSYRVIAEEVQ